MQACLGSARKKKCNGNSIKCRPKISRFKYTTIKTKADFKSLVTFITCDNAWLHAVGTVLAIIIIKCVVSCSR